MKHVVSVSIGSSSRDTHQAVKILGEDVFIERRGTDGDLSAAAAMIRNLDGRVDAIGLGGIDLYLYAGKRRYVFRDALRLASQASKTPIVCGAGLKNTLERSIVEQLDAVIGWQGKRVLMVSALDRFGMAEALIAADAKVLYGDVIFALGLPIAIYKLSTLQNLARALLPVLTQLPFKWLYPTGTKQEQQKRPEHNRFYDWADVIAGDWHFINKYAPKRLDDKIILTNTTTSVDVEALREMGAKSVITTTPRFRGRSLATNLLEAAFVAISGKFPLSTDDYRELVRQAELNPTVLELKAIKAQ